MSAADRYRRWFEYEQDSHLKTLASLETVHSELRSLPSFQKAVNLMAHVVAARKMWLFRFGAAPDWPRELFPQQVALAELTKQVNDMHAAWAAWLSELDDAELARSFEYQSFEGGWYRNTIEDILTQLFGHSWYHRGQIAALIRSIGGDPAVTDFVFWTRESLPLR